MLFQTAAIVTLFSLGQVLGAPVASSNVRIRNDEVAPETTYPIADVDSLIDDIEARAPKKIKSGHILDGIDGFLQVGQMLTGNSEKQLNQQQ